MSRVFANGPGDWGSLPGWVIQKTQKMVLDTSMLNTQYYKVQIKGKVEQSRERSSALPDTWVKREPSGHSWLRSLTYNSQATQKIAGYHWSSDAMRLFNVQRSDHLSHNSYCHHHHHVVRLARISLSTSPYHSLPLAGLQGYIPYHHIAAVCMFELVILLLIGHIGGVHRSMSITSSSLLLQQCPACLVHLAWIVFMIGGRWLYSWCLVGCCCQDLFNIALNILV